MGPLGMIGGLGPEATIEYYRLLVEEYRKRTEDDSYPAIIINSVNLTQARGLVEAQKYVELTAYMVAEIERLAGAGAVLGFMSANTPHVVFDGIRERSPIPLVSIVEAACDAAKALGLRRVGLIGTRFTMEGRFFPDVFAREGIGVVVPNAEEREYINERYWGELVKGVFLPETRAGLLGIVEKLKARDEIEGVILGGTELPLILPEGWEGGIPFLDTTRIHVRAVVERWLG